MARFRRSIAIVSVALLGPAVVFIGAVVATQLQPVQYQPARFAERIVETFSALPGPWLTVLVVLGPIIACGLAAWSTASTLRADSGARADLRVWSHASRRLLRHGSLVVSVLAIAVAILVLAVLVVHAIVD